MGSNRLRTVLSIVGVALGVSVMLAIQLANQGSLRGFSAALDAVSGKAALEITCPPLGVDETLVPQLSWLREIGIATPVIEADVTAETGLGSETLRLIGIDALRDPALRDYAVSGASATGMELMTFLAQPDSVILTSSFAQRHHLKAGDTLALLVGDRRREVKVVQILGGDSNSALAAQSLGVMDIASAQVALDRLGRVDRIEVRLHEDLPVEKAEQILATRLPAGLTVQRPQRRSAAVEKMLAAFHFNLTMLSGIALVVGLFLIYNTISVAVMTRRSEIGMLRTLGVTRGQVLRLFLGEALLLGVIGALLGVPLAKLLAEGAIMLTSTTVDTLYVATAAKVPPLTIWHWLAGLGIAVPLSLLASALPAREAALLSPVEAVRSDAGASAAVNSKGGVRRAAVPAGVCLVAGFIAARQEPVFGLPLWGHFASLCAIMAAAFAVPVALGFMARIMRPLLARVFGIEGRLAASQIQASTARLSISVAALTVALALTVAIAVMVGSFRQTVLYWVDQTMGADLYIRPGTPPRSQSPPTFSEATLKILREQPDVLAFDGYRAMDLPFRDRIIKLGTGDFDVQMQHGRIALKTPGDAKAILQLAKERGEIFVSESFALRFRVREGDAITLNTPKGNHEFRIAAQFYDYSNDSGTITMDQREFQKWFGDSLPTHVALYLKPGVDPENVRTELLRQLDGRGLVAIFTNAGLRAEVLRIFDATFAITWALEIIAVLVAMAGVAATMLTLVLERRAEIRLLRIAGADAGQVRRTIMLESGILGLVSQVLGLIVGILLSLVLIHVINPQSFGWSIRFHTPWWFLIGSTVLTVAGTMLAGFYPAWRVTRGAGLALLLLLACPASGQDWKPALPGYEYTFPRDHGQHPEQKIEWWYYTGNLATADGRRFGYQLTFFRIGATPTPANASPWALRDVWMAHFAVSDLTGGKYHHADRLNRAGPGLAGATTERVWNEDWQVRLSTDGKMSLTATDRDFSIQLDLGSGENPVIHGQGGISQKGITPGNASHYYSLARMPTKGSLIVGGETFTVTGESWMDHEFGTSFLEKGTQGWDWFSAQLSDGSELMLFQLRGAAPGSNAGTLIQPDGTVISLSASDFTLTPGTLWKSPTGAQYPITWQIAVPKHQLTLECRAAMPNQEFSADATPGLDYWEGAVGYSGTSSGQVITGRGYLEMTGYSGQAMSVWFGTGP
ncbi:MAG: lipocalin-like domain-containing protein [Prosthecobacter sp.]